MRLSKFPYARWRLRLLAVHAVTLLAAIAVVALGVQPVISEPPRESAGAEAPGLASTAQVVADQALAAFANSAVDMNQPSTPARRRAGLPTDPVAGLTSQTPAGPVQMVLPSGLGAGEHTAGGHVVYPDNGAGFDLLAENTSTGTRTVARITHPSGVRMVTTFVRTPADTVMLAHTNGYLTINRATPAAETVAMFSPAETRDAAGNLVPSSYIVRQVAPQLYQLSEVIDPGPTTMWPVFVDPPLHLAGAGGTPLPQFDLSFSGITDAVGSGLDALGNAASTAANATVSAASSVGTFVKENPLESTMLVGGVALALTGVGGPASAAVIAAASVNIASAGVDFAAAAIPDNQALGIASTTLGIASTLTPQGAAKQVAEEGLEQLAKHGDDIIDVTKTAPTPPTQLSQQISGAGSSTPPTNPLADTPKAANAPPATPEPNASCGCLSSDAKGGTYEIHASGGVIKTGRTNDLARRSGELRRRPDLPHHEFVPNHRTDDIAEQRGLEQMVRERHFGTADKANGGFDRINGVDPANKRAAEYRAAAQRHLNRWGTETNPRPSSPADQRISQATRAEAITDRQRQQARESAHQVNQSGGQRGGDSGSRSGGRSFDGKNHKDKKNKKDKRSKKQKDKKRR